jgi:hypothetical protein
MTGITKLLFGCVTLHAGIHQALLVFLLTDCHIKRSVPGPKNRIPPLVEKLHMLGPHILGRQNALVILFGQLRLRYWACIPLVVPDGKRDKQDEDDQSRNDFTTIIHCFSSTPARELKDHGPKTFGQIRSLFTFYNKGIANKLADATDLNIGVPVVH